MNVELYREAFEAHRRAIWGLCYRMTGSAADADDLVQETFARAIERPPPDLDRPLAPWLAKVAVNLGRDLLRARKTQGYDGAWLPAPIETERGPPPSLEVILADGESTEARYDLMESVSIAFLIALEALTPTKRAVLLLRDVFGYSVKETAAALDLSEANVKTTLHRARAEMEAYDKKRARKSNEEHLEALTKFFGLLVQRDLDGLEKLLAENIRATSDGGGEYFAARRPILGKKKVIKFFDSIQRQPSWFEVRELNGVPALVAAFSEAEGRDAPKAVFLVELDAEGRIVELHSILATRKLSGVRFPE
jgi:RNA polymerase sigma-70 factor, ECF subfamily